MNKTQSPRRSRGRTPKRTNSAPGNMQSNGRSKGNPKQLVDKYKSQARDAMQAGDRVLAENYLQYADHYQRLLNERMGPPASEETETDRSEAEDEARPARRRSRSQRARDAAESDQPSNDPRAEDNDPRRDGQDAASAASEDPQAARGDNAARQDGEDQAPAKPRRRRAPRKAGAQTDADSQAESMRSDAMAK